MIHNRTETKRRDFIKLMTLAGGSFAAMHALNLKTFAKEDIEALIKRNIPLVKLPYETSALAPYISEKTVKQHYNDHHLAYYKRLTGYLRKNPEYSNRELVDLIQKTRGGILLEDALHNFSTLLWNHNFYWQSMKPKGGILPPVKSQLSKRVVQVYGSIDNFKKAFKEKSMQLGIGWVWLVQVKYDLQIIRTKYSESPVPSPYPPLFGIDIWEHSYYMDYGADREKYVDAFLNNLINWQFAESNFVMMKKK